MTFAPGARFGPYEVTSILGEGGMGQVYRARDVRLDRDVALKVLPPALTVDADRLARFKREAHVLASLNHQNIAALYGMEQGRSSDSEPPVDALVLELVEGPTLAERIAAGPLPLDEARAIGMQIASALEAAHERGIVHRDLKPANIKVRADGTVKVLDFGLAKAWEPSSQRIDISQSPTLMSPAATGVGILLGTAGYMSPEQARGAPVDKRTDVWAFGCVLFEMLAGRHVFGGAATVSDAIAAVLKSEPDWLALPESTPRHIRSLLKRCLEKDPRRRLRDIGDAGLLLGDDPDIGEMTGQQPRAPAAGSRWTTWAAVAGWSVALVLAIVNALWLMGGFRSAPRSPAVAQRLALPLAAQLAAAGDPIRSFDVSADGTRIVYLGRDSTGFSLYLEDLANGDLKRLAETAGASLPAFSPDGRAVGFMSGSAIKLLPLESGLPRDITRVDAETWVDWAWSGPDHILVSGPSGLLRVPIKGGAPELVAKPTGAETVFTSAVALPGGAYIVAVRAKRTDDPSRIDLVLPGDAERRVVAERGGSPTFVAGEDDGLGHIVYAESGRLLALPFDAAKRVVTGSAVPMVENVAMRPNGDWAQYDVSPTGALVFREGSLHELVSVDRGSGAVRPLSTNLRRFALPRFSPDGKRVAVEMHDSPHQIWTLDIERDVLVPLTTEPNGSHNFAWAPDGTSILYTLGDITPPQLGWIWTNGSPNAERIAVGGDSRVLVADWSRDGHVALRGGNQPKYVVMTARLDGGAPPKAAGALVRIAEGQAGTFSPDGSWLSYAEMGSADRPGNIFIHHLASGTKHQVSIDGGIEPMWSASGGELFFRNGTKMMVVDLTIAGTAVRIGRPQMVFEGDYLEWNTANYDVSADGKQFVMVRTANANTRTLSVRLNWASEMERLAPTRP